MSAIRNALDALAASIVRRGWTRHVDLVILVGAVLTVLAFVSTVLAAVGEPALHQPASLGQMLIFPSGFVAIVVFWLGLGGRVFLTAKRLERESRDAALSAKYGVTVRHRHADVWEVDGEPRQGTLTTGDTLLIGGRELDRA